MSINLAFERFALKLNSSNLKPFLWTVLIFLLHYRTKVNRSCLFSPRNTPVFLISYPWKYPREERRPSSAFNSKTLELLRSWITRIRDIPVPLNCRVDARKSRGRKNPKSRSRDFPSLFPSSFHPPFFLRLSLRLPLARLTRIPRASFSIYGG